MFKELETWQEETVQSSGASFVASGFASSGDFRPPTSKIPVAKHMPGHGRKALRVLPGECRLALTAEDSLPCQSSRLILRRCELTTSSPAVPLIAPDPVFFFLPGLLSESTNGDPQARFSARNCVRVSSLRAAYSLAKALFTCCESDKLLRLERRWVETGGGGIVICAVDSRQSNGGRSRIAFSDSAGNQTEDRIAVCGCRHVAITAGTFPLLGNAFIKSNSGRFPFLPAFSWSLKGRRLQRVSDEKRRFRGIYVGRRIGLSPSSPAQEAGEDGVCGRSGEFKHHSLSPFLSFAYYAVIVILPTADP